MGLVDKELFLFEISFLDGIGKKGIIEDFLKQLTLKL